MSTDERTQEYTDKVKRFTQFLAAEGFEDILDQRVLLAPELVTPALVLQHGGESNLKILEEESRDPLLKSTEQLLETLVRLGERLGVRKEYVERGLRKSPASIQKFLRYIEFFVGVSLSA